MSDKTTDATMQAPTWSPLLRLELFTTQSGLLSLGAETPANLHVVGRSLEEVFTSMIQFIKDCDALGKPFAILEGVKLNAES